ncbi:MAG TPA: serine/threonine-protein kinase [Labilithrix sp.]|jgi:serine/threonine-protein kinase|nr:serine/threonine-protein kinase [Labilithrix sp.]
MGVPWRERVKARHTYPSGQTRASRLKALLSCLDAEKGTVAADAWLAKLRLARGDLDDETRLLPLVALHSALAAFSKQLPGGLDRTASYFASRDNLGVWARVLRVARSPEEAFERIESSDSEYGRTTRWEKIEGRPGYWRGRVKISHDPKLEKDGLLARARGIELSMIPTLFGYPRGTVKLREKKDDVQEFEVRWSFPRASRDAFVGAAAGATIGASVLATHPSLGATIAAVVMPVVGSAIGLFWFRERGGRIETAAQAMRVSALERSLALRETEHLNAAGDLEGAVVAGQYRIGARMGSGASGVIYEATRITDGLPVAIKLLRAAAVHDVTASDRLRRESEALGLSWHPNVVESIDHGHLPDGTTYLVMELLHGETLATRLHYRSRLPASEVLPIAKQVAEALVAIHAAGVVHRDLKPSNIYLVPDENMPGPIKERVKVFDFGIARVEWEEMRITTIGAPMGTPGYMSPEQESGEEIDARSDVFAAGAVIYECLVGEPPPLSSEDMWKPVSRSPSSLELRLEVEGKRSDSGVHQASRPISSSAPTPLDSRAPGPVDAPPEWRAIVERALAKRADERFQDARALLAAIRTLEPVESKPPQGSTGSDRP